MEDALIHSLSHGQDFKDVMCLRVSRLWDFYDLNDGSKLMHFNLVLLDEEGNSIHCQMYPPLDEQFRGILKEGGVYNFQYFKVKTCNRSYKPVKNPFMVSFSKWTTVEEVVEVPPAFPLYTYSLTPLEKIPGLLNVNDYLIDVLGVVTEISNVYTHRVRARQTDSIKRTVNIRNARASVTVVFWGETATAFPGEQVYEDGKNSPQVVMFVGGLVREYSDGVYLTGNTSCKWYINPDVAEANVLMASVREMHEPVKWNEHGVPNLPPPAAENKKVSEIKDLNPYQFGKTEFLVTVTIRKIDSTWWYHACKMCMHSAKRHGDSYKCTGIECGAKGFPVNRYRLCIVAGDETGDTDFIVFGRIAQRLIKKSADTLIAANPSGFIPDEITKLLERVFVWNVTCFVTREIRSPLAWEEIPFTENTKLSGNVCFQVNGIVGEIGSGNALVPMTPTTSQASSVMLSPGASGSVQGTPQKDSRLPLPALPTSSCASYGSSGPPSKMVVSSTGAPMTPQSRKTSIPDEVADPKLGAGITAATDQSAGKSQKSVIGKRTHRSPSKGVSKKLLLDEEVGDKDSTTDADDLGGFS